MRTFLLGVLTAAVLVIAVVLVYSTFIKANAPDTHRERQRAEDYFRENPGYLCTFGGNGAGGLTSPAYLACVDEQVASQLRRWEDAGRPNPADIEPRP